MKIFFSYPHDGNAPLVERIKADLEERGHEVWFDAAQIKSGDDWRNSITRGILDSEQVVAFLSKHAVRDPGVCLNEIAIALADKGEAMVTVLVEPETEVSTPVSITHIQWLRMEDWQSHEQDPGWYKTRLDRLVEAIENPSHACRNDELETLRLALDPMSFYAEIAPHIPGFVGRRWIIDRYNTWLADEPQSRVLRIEGGPGLGKTAVTSYLAHSAKSSVLGVHLCQYNSGESRNPLRLVRTLAYQLATRLPDYRARLLKSVSIQKPETMQGKDPASLWGDIITAPLAGAGKGNIDRQRLAIIIDGLDEATVDGKNPIVELLATEISKLPTWIGVVLTGRPDPELTQRLSRYKPMVLSDDDPQNVADLRVYVDDWLAMEIRANKLTASQAHAAGNALLAKSQGAFLYLRQARTAVNENMLDLTQPEQFPNGLAEIYQRFFERRFPDVSEDSGNYKTKVRPLLELVLASPEPLPVSVAKELLKWGPYDGPKAIASLGSLLKRTKSGQGNEDQEMLAPFHNSVRKWLQDADAAGDFFANCEEARLPLTNAVWRRYLVSGEKDTYGRAVLPELLGRLGRSKDELVFGTPAQTTTNTLSRLGDDLAEKFRIADAGLIYHTAEVISKSLCALDPKNTSFAISRCVILCKLSDVSYAVGKSDVAILGYRKSIQVAEAMFDEVADAPPSPERSRTIRDFARTSTPIYNKLGRALSRQGQTAEARDHFRRSSFFAELLAKAAPENIEFELDVVDTYNWIGDMDTQLGDSSAALAQYQKSFVIAERLSARNPDDVASASKLCECYDKIGNSQRRLHATRAALESYRQSLTIAERLATLLPESGEAGRRLCSCYGKVGAIFWELREFSHALKWHQKGAAIADRLATSDPDNAIFKREQFINYMHLGDAQMGLNDLEVAFESYLKGSQIADHLASLDSSNAVAAMDLCVCYGKMGNMAMLLSDYQTASFFYEKCKIISADLVIREPDNLGYARELGIAYLWLGNVHCKLNKFSAALVSYQKSATIIEPWMKQDSTNNSLAVDLCGIYDKVGDTLSRIGEMEAALTCFGRLVIIAYQLVKRDADNTKFKCELCTALYNVGNVHAKLGHNELSIEAYKLSSGIVGKLVALEPQNNDFAIMRDTINAKLAVPGAEGVKQ